MSRLMPRLSEDFPKVPPARSLTESSDFEPEADVAAADVCDVSVRRTLVESPLVHGYYIERGGDTLVITFNTRILDGGIPHQGWGEIRLGKLGYDVFALIDLKGLWYPQRDMRVMQDFITPHLSRYREIVTYGFSMGAYAALKYSAVLGASRAYAFSPQYSIRPKDIAGFDPRRSTEFYQAEHHDRMAIEAGDLCPEAFVVYDPFFAIDREHVRLIARAGRIREVRACFTGHFSIRSLTETGSAGALLGSLRAGHGEPARDLRNRIREARARSPTYMLEAAQLLAAKGERHAAKAIYFARRAVRLAPRNAAARSHLVDLLTVEDNAPKSVWSRLAGRIRPTDKTAARAAILSELAKEQPYFLGDLVRLHAEAGRIETAKAVAEQAAAADIDDTDYWLGLAKILRQLDDGADAAALALGLAERALKGGKPTAELRRYTCELALAAQGRVELPFTLFRPGVAARKGRGGLVADLDSPGQIVRDGPRFLVSPGHYTARIHFQALRGLKDLPGVSLAIEIGTTPILANEALATGPATPVLRTELNFGQAKDSDALEGEPLTFSIEKRQRALRMSIALLGPAGARGAFAFGGITLSRDGTD